MNLDKHLPALDPALRHVLTEMTDPDPEKRPQRARDVVALLAKTRPPAELDPRPAPARSIQRTSSGPPARQLFSDISEPLGTLLRLGVLGFGLGGWLGMASIRVSLTIAFFIGAALAFPARKKILHVNRELDAMLAEGQGGFTDMMKGAMARR